MRGNAFWTGDLAATCRATRCARIRRTRKFCESGPTDRSSSAVRRQRGGRLAAVRGPQNAADWKLMGLPPPNFSNEWYTGSILRPRRLGKRRKGCGCPWGWSFRRSSRNSGDSDEDLHREAAPNSQLHTEPPRQPGRFRFHHSTQYGVEPKARVRGLSTVRGLALHC